MLFFWNFVLRMWLERNGTIIFIFSHSRPFPPYVVFQSSQMVFFNFFAIFFEFCITDGIGEERNGTIIFFSLVLDLHHPIFSSKEATVEFFNFLNFFEFCIANEIGTKRNDSFYFLSFSFFSTLFWLQKKPQQYFIIFWFFFCYFFGIFYYASGKNKTER